MRADSRGAWTAVQRLDLETNAALVPRSPAADAIAYPAPVAFEWERIAGAVSYELRYAPRGDFSNAVTVANLADPVFVPQDSLAPNDWSWQVRAKLFSHSSESLHTPWSAPVQFSVEWKPSDSRVETLTPSDALNPAISDPLFTWKPVTGASYYTLQIAQDADMGTLLDVNPAGNGAAKKTATVYGTSFELDDALLNGAYHWRVTAHDLEGRAGAVSEPKRFQKAWGMQPEANHESGSTLARPTTDQGATEAHAAPEVPFNEFMLSWSPVPRATLYAIELNPIIEASEAPNPPSRKPGSLSCRTANTSATITWKTLKSLPASTLSYTTTKGKKGKYLYIKVAAKGQYGYGAYSAVKKVKKR